MGLRVAAVVGERFQERVAVPVEAAARAVLEIILLRDTGFPAQLPPVLPETIVFIER